MKSLFFRTVPLLTIVFTFLAHADFSIPLKANPILCFGVSELHVNSKISLKLVTTDEHGAYSVRYIVDDQDAITVESKYPLLLTYEGSLYIQTYDEAGKVTLTISNGDIKTLSRDLNDSNFKKLAYVLEGRFQTGAEAFQVSCLGSFVK